MSIVSTVTIFTSVLDGWGVDRPDGHGETKIIANVNNWLSRQPWGGRLKDLTVAYGGSKHAEQGIWGGAFNMLDVDEFASFVLALPWEDKRDFLMVIQTHEGAPRVWDAYGEMENRT